MTVYRPGVYSAHVPAEAMMAYTTGGISTRGKPSLSKAVMAALESKFAAPRMAADESVPAYNCTSGLLSVQATLTPTHTGTLKGRAHITGPQLAQVLGQTTVDLAHLTDIEFTAATTNIAANVGATLSTGTGESTSTFATPDRVYHVMDGGPMTGCHTVIGPSSGCGAVATYSGLGGVSVHFSNDVTAQMDARHALGRSLRWAGNDVSKSIAGSCTSVGIGESQRWLVPAEASEHRCSMSTLFGVNSNQRDFCDHRYSDKNATFAHDQKGRNCKVVTAADFAEVKTALQSRLSEKSCLQHGLNFEFETFAADDRKLHAELTKAGFTPSVTLGVKLNRITTNDFLSQDLSAGNSMHVTTADMHAMLGEVAPVHAVTEAAMATTPASFAQAIMGLSLKGENTSVDTNGTVTITTGGD